MAAASVSFEEELKRLLRRHGFKAIMFGLKLNSEMPVSIGLADMNPLNGDGGMYLAYNQVPKQSAVNVVPRMVIE